MSRFDLDRDGRITDTELAQVPVPRRWDRFGLRGPAIVLRFLTRNARRLAVLVAGGAVLAAGAAMLVLPGPGLIVMILGLVILATEFAWAERALDRAQHRTQQALDAVHRHRRGRHALAASAVLMLGAGAGTTVAAPDARMVGVSLLLGGACALATLHPRVRAWIGRRAQRTPGP